MSIFLIILAAIAIVFIGYLSNFILRRKSHHRRDAKRDSVEGSVLPYEKKPGYDFRKDAERIRKQNDDVARQNRQLARRTQQILDDNKKRMDRDRKLQEDITRRQMRKGRGW